MKGLTLSTNATVSSNTNSFANPVLCIFDVLVLRTISMLFLRFVEDRVVLGGYQCRHKNPFRDGRAMDATRRRERDVGVLDDPMVGPSIDASGKEVDELHAAISYQRSDW